MAKFGPPIEVQSLLSAEMSLFTSCKSKSPTKSITLQSYLAGVRSGKWDRRVEAVRKANLDAKANADRLKIKLPFIKPSGVFSGLKQTDFIKHSGVLVIDLDDVDDLVGVREILPQHNSVIAFHLSPRGTGLKVFVAISATNSSEHKACWSLVHESLGAFLPSSVKIDQAPSNVSSNCFVSWDPDLWIADDPRVPFLPSCLTPLSTAPEKEKEKERDTISEDSMGGRHSMGGLGGKSHVTQSVNHEHKKVLRSQSRRRREAKAEIKKLNPVLRRIYKQYLGNRSVVSGERNTFVINVFPPLYCVVGTEVLIELLKLHHQKQTGIWTTNIGDHMAQVHSMIESWGLKYEGNLADPERVRYSDLGQNMRAAFRIIRDLCGQVETAFMSHRELGFRLGVAQSTARDYLRELQAIGAIKKMQAGEKWTSGRKPKATEYRWSGTEPFTELLP